MTEPMTPRRRATTERLLAAAREVIVERGLPAASVEEISERAGFTRGAFYSNYAGMDDLIAALVRDISARRIAAIESSVAVADASADTLAEAVVHGVTAFLSLDLGGPEEVVLVTELQLWAVRNPQFRPLLAELADDTLHFLETAIDSAVQAYGAHYTVERDSVTRALNALYDYYSLRSIIQPGDRTAQSLAGIVNLLIADSPGR